ncbi:glutathione peroxidase [Marinococcus luteus]|uniref:glutathione peroxidase n=1 Tax=Marinococcus luteus TaxID=1122204 RepID=UPI002ACC778F|nr:glutathione peroxidase [Marinococcus luteus]MDZ5782545.1 glutathione peroxidase [Marinococcus luteus]
MTASIYNIEAVHADGTEKTLHEYRGEVLLIVNTASECGFTPQYEELEELYQRYKNQGFQVLGFPSNDFGGQEPDTIENITEFCETNYGVSFDIFDKVHAKGNEKHPLFDWLLEQTSPEREIEWNFEKFLVSRYGEVLGSFKSSTKPTDPQITSMIETSLQQY